MATAEVAAGCSWRCFVPKEALFAQSGWRGCSNLKVRIVLLRGQSLAVVTPILL